MRSEEWWKGRIKFWKRPNIFYKGYYCANFFPETFLFIISVKVIKGYGNDVFS